MSDNSLLGRLEGLDSRFEEVSTLITDPSVIADMPRYVRLTKEYKDLERLLKVTNRYRSTLASATDARKLLETESDEELRAMAREELDECQKSLPELEDEIRLLLLPADPEDSK
ncbi:MAG: PCRF domain-containing protein, partial [Paramuribaculum sp.]|nr:PCRF domain-containing protein [Paramuribaculum sp.]